EFDMIGLFRFSPSRLALVYVALSALVLGLFAIPLWYVWRVNYSTLRTYIDAEDVRTMVDTFEREGPSGLAAAIEARVRILPRDDIGRTAWAIAGGDLARRVPARGGSAELDTLAQTVNGMLEQLARQNLRLEDEVAVRRHAEQALQAAQSGLEGLIARRTAELAQANQWLLAQHVVTQTLAEAATLEQAVPNVLRAVCEFLNWDFGALWSIDREKKVLRCVEVWHKESVSVPQFATATLASTFGRGIGLPGCVWAS